MTIAHRWMLLTTVLCAVAATAAMADPSLPGGYTSKVWADDKQLANPVCIAIDEKGRIYVGETFRQNKGVDDNRGPVDRDVFARELDYYQIRTGRR